MLERGLLDPHPVGLDYYSTWYGLRGAFFVGLPLQDVADVYRAAHTLLHSVKKLAESRIVLWRSVYTQQPM